ncbi:MAG: hypothetical protein WDO73_01980 [Ignavibacteriota bacterium]
MTRTSLSPEAAINHQDSSGREIVAAQVRLLYGNAGMGVGITFIAAPILGLLQWEVVPHPLILTWCLCMFVISVARFALTRRYRRLSPAIEDARPWALAFTIGSGCAGVGWGSAAILLYPEGRLANQVFLLFILGGMMLGAASLLAPRPEAFVAFMVPAGLVPRRPSCPGAR